MTYNPCFAQTFSSLHSKSTLFCPALSPKTSQHVRTTSKSPAYMTTTPSKTPPKSDSLLQPQTPSPRLLSFLSRSQEGNPALSLAQADLAFSRLKSPQIKIPQSSFVTSIAKPHSPQTPPFDVIVIGGTLGIFHAVAWQALGHRVVLLERGRVQGRSQEWNISRHELSALIRNNVVSAEQLEEAIVTEFLGEGRIGFNLRDGEEKQVGITGVLNVGIAPDILVAAARDNFERLGGVIIEYCSVNGVEVGLDSVKVVTKQTKLKVDGALGAGGTGLVSEEDGDVVKDIYGRVLVDAMGAFSPIAAQTRGYRKPDGVCITVGSCMRGSWPENETGDLIYATNGINADRSAQYFWEAFPVGRDNQARTTYMFAYGPCVEKRQSLTEALEDYLEGVEEYQKVQVDNMEVKRILFGFFPTYFKDSPTKVSFDRVLPVGDAGGLQSPISFGGFGCCMRHLDRITGALNEALQSKSDSLLMKDKLQMMQWYLPSLSVAGLFHKAMSVQPGQKKAGAFLDEYGINEVLWSNMKAMADLGEDVQRPFLQDVVTAKGLSQTLAVMALRNPILALKMTAFLGPGEIVDWSRHFFSLVGYAAFLPILNSFVANKKSRGQLSPEQEFRLNRLVDNMKYGSGSDAVRSE